MAIEEMGDNMKEKNEELKQFNDKDLLNKIFKELNRDHVGDPKEKMFLFCSYISSMLHPDYRMSVALLGDSSVGKDNIDNTCIKHLPAGSALKVTRITGSSLEDDVKEFNAISIGEGNFAREDGSNKAILEYVKQLAESGTHVIKKDVKTGYKEPKNEKQDRKVVVYSTTDLRHDQELSTRFCVLSIGHSPGKTHAINEDTLRKSADVQESIAQRQRNTEPSWIAHGLRFLKYPDYIVIPFAEHIPVDSGSPRSQRDLKRFLNLIRVLAFLNQRNRLFVESTDGDNILYAAPEDLLNALEIGSEIFEQSYSDIEWRLQRVLDVFDLLPGESIEDSPGLWIRKKDIQDNLAIKNRDTLNKRLKELSNKGIIQGIRSGRDVFYKCVQKAFNLPLIPVQKYVIYRDIDKKYSKIIERIERVNTINRTHFVHIKTVCIDLSEHNAFNYLNTYTKRVSGDKIERVKLNGLGSEIAQYCKEPTHRDAIKSTFGVSDNEIDCLLNGGILQEVSPGRLKRI